MPRAKTRTHASFFDPPGEDLKGSRPPSIHEIIKFKNLNKVLYPEKTERELIKVILPPILDIWRKVHPAIPIRSENSLTEHLIQIFKKYQDCQDKRLSANIRRNTVASGNTIFNCTPCKCKLPESPCMRKNCSTSGLHTHINCTCKTDKVQ